MKLTHIPYLMPTQSDLNALVQHGSVVLPTPNISLKPVGSRTRERQFSKIDVSKALAL